MPSIIDLYQSYGIETAQDGHKHYRPGWINVGCPHCGFEQDRYHLGFNLEGGYYYCWRCGGHPVKYTLSKLLKLNTAQIEEILTTYRLKQRARSADAINSAKAIRIGDKKRYKHPSEVTSLTTAQMRYLSNRGFDPEYLASVWGLLGTGPTSKLDNISYKLRILFPILWNEREVSFQARDYTNKQAKKYMACPESRELIHHKHILYGHPSLWKARKGIVVEGAFDVWRFKEKACATLGTGFTSEQVRLMSKVFDQLVIMFDPEPIAQVRAKKLQSELTFRGVRVSVYNNLSTDPGALSDVDAAYILKELKL
jgi:hypothetical protein